MGRDAATSRHVSPGPDHRLLRILLWHIGADNGFDPEFPVTGLDGHVALHLKNATTLLALAECDQGISPTKWQHSTFPPQYQSKIEVIHEGINCNLARPDARAVLELPSGLRLSASDEVVTFVARNL